ncbi:MAG: electron transport complex subunit RsxE [Clostridiales bacterium GWF2_36_10]|nr:MAG: electron transport complex subunit RsxE [Clostridiales bacterium GWF2_36_10]HAN21542.1 electron transport complex subunit RsxE [Clostridiales bacterium]
MDKNKSLKFEFTKGFIKENPVLCLLLGTCPTLAVTTGAMNAIGMGIAATLVLIGSNAVISLLRRFIPDSVRIPAYITVIAGFVTIVQLLVKAFMPSIDQALGIFLPLIVVNCIILGRAEMYASKNSVLFSTIDGLGMGVGFTAAMLCMGIIRELFGSGSVFGLTLLPESIFTPITIFILPAGGFFVFGILIALSNSLQHGKLSKKEFGCENCPSAAACSKISEKKCDTGKDGGK